MAQMNDSNNLQEATLGQFVQDFVKTHAVVGRGAGEIVLDVTPQEYEKLGRNFIQILGRWVAGLQFLTVIKFMTRRLHSTANNELIVEVSPQECMTLGQDLAQVLVGWAGGVTLVRQRESGTLFDRPRAPYLTLVSQTGELETNESSER
jgi:hypothetical protein